MILVEHASGQRIINAFHVLKIIPAMANFDVEHKIMSKNKDMIIQRLIIPNKT